MFKHDAVITELALKTPVVLIVFNRPDTTATVFEQRGAATDRDAVWGTASVGLNSFAGQTISILIEAADAGNASLVEAAVDDVAITQR